MEPRPIDAENMAGCALLLCLPLALCGLLIPTSALALGLGYLTYRQGRQFQGMVAMICATLFLTMGIVMLWTLE